jgi:hypothetical protein
MPSASFATALCLSRSELLVDLAAQRRHLVVELPQRLTVEPHGGGDVELAPDLFEVDGHGSEPHLGFSWLRDRDLLQPLPTSLDGLRSRRAGLTHRHGLVEHFDRLDHAGHVVLGDQHLAQHEHQRGGERQEQLATDRHGCAREVDGRRARIRIRTGS